jgi:hypothetical protein
VLGGGGGLAGVLGPIDQDASAAAGFRSAHVCDQGRGARR